MPIYTYRCENCGIQFERHQEFNDPPLKICPECKHNSLRKVYLPVGIVFKGSGFYSTDNRSTSGANSYPHKKTEKVENSDDKVSEPNPKKKVDKKEE